MGFEGMMPLSVKHSCMAAEGNARETASSGLASLARPAGGGVGVRLIVFGVAVIMLLWAGIGWDVARERERVLRDAEAGTANLARAFAEHILRTIGALDQTLLNIKAEYERNPKAFALSRAVGSVGLQWVSVQIAIIGSDGYLAQSTIGGATIGGATIGGPVALDLSDREHFRVHAGADTGELHISKPVQGRVSGRSAIQLTRRLNLADGGFAGVAVISLDPNYLAEVYNSVDIGPGGVVMLAGLDGVVRVASGDLGRIMGKTLRDTGMMAALAAARSGNLRVDGPHDQVRRLIGYQVLDGLPLAVVVGRAEGEVLADQQSIAAGYFAVGAALTAVLGGAILLLVRMVRRQDAITRDLGLKKEELVESRNRLRRYVADLERIAEVAAHDMQAPLRRVVAYAQLLAESAAGRLDDEGRGYVDHVIEGARRMRALVRQLEDFVSVDHAPAPTATAAAGAALERARARLAEPLAASGTVLTAEPLPDVVADERGLAEIFVQLVDNAIRHCPGGQVPHIHVAAQADGAMAVFSVRDNAAGIERRQLTRVFEIFHRLDGQGAEDRLGMGLAITRRLVERLGGRIWVESEPGQGSTFSFSLPLGYSTLALDRDARGQEVKAA